MPALNNISAAAVCDANKSLLQKNPVTLVDERGLITLSLLEPKEKKDFLDQFYENERSNLKYIKENYLKQKYQAKNTVMLLITALGLLATGVFLAPLFVIFPITIPITIPIFSILLVGISFISLTWFYFNRGLSRLETKMLNSEIILSSLKVDAESNQNEIHINRQIQEIKAETEVISEKLNVLVDNKQSLAGLLAKQGTFPTISSHDDAANKELTNDVENSFNPV